MMVGSGLRLVRRALAAALLTGALIATQVHAETGSANGGAWVFATNPGSYTEVDGSTTYTASGYTSGNAGADTLKANIKGGNNSTGWHFVDEASASCGTGTCQPRQIVIDNSLNNPPSTGHYATTLHEYWVGGTQVGGFWTSSDGAHSSQSCWFNPGC